MANTTVDSRHEELPTEAQHDGPRALESRAAAVGHVARGGFLSVLGLSMGLSADFAGLGHWSVYLLAGGIATVGLRRNPHRCLSRPARLPFYEVAPVKAAYIGHTGLVRMQVCIFIRSIPRDRRLLV